jgi:hypothetical protein
VKLSVILSDAETTKVRRDSGELEPLMLNTTHSIESLNRPPLSYPIGTSGWPNRRLHYTCKWT